MHATTRNVPYADWRQKSHPRKHRWSVFEGCRLLPFSSDSFSSAYLFSVCICISQFSPHAWYLMNGTEWGSGLPYGSHFIFIWARRSFVHIDVGKVYCGYIFSFDHFHCSFVCLDCFPSVGVDWLVCLVCAHRTGGSRLALGGGQLSHAGAKPRVPQILFSHRI